MGPSISVQQCLTLAVNVSRFAWVLVSLGQETLGQVIYFLLSLSSLFSFETALTKIYIQILFKLCLSFGMYYIKVVDDIHDLILLITSGLM